MIQIEGLRLGPAGIVLNAFGCSNDDCAELTVWADLHPVYTEWGETFGDSIEHYGLRPKSCPPKHFPDYIPVAIRQDYEEACAIVDLSPKAAATLARRAIQGMIRDFAQISDKTLIKEIQRLRKAVDDRTAPAEVAPETVDAIDHVRRIGNIGAHMEKDVELIIPVEPNEARALIGLIEMLLQEWYVARETRKARLQHLKRIGDDKNAAKMKSSEPDAIAALLGGAAVPFMSE